MDDRHCACGCGGLIPWQKHHRYKPPSFIPGHQSASEGDRKAREARKHRPPPDYKAPNGLCECGCGERTPIAKQSHAGKGLFAGVPLRYIHGHNPRGKRAFGWKGGRTTNRRGYVLIWVPGHHLANRRGYALEHRVVWEQSNGRRLRADEDVHHLDGNKANNAPENLQAIPHAEHSRVHDQLGKLRKAATH